ncbi:MAG: A/G-specific adenine glycosylase [bacterium]|nr:A/G-specific adenine glycosylase [bacterium]
MSRYQKYGRKLPWRQTKDPYAIHVSEVMLQQTQVARVLPYFDAWLKKWPDSSTLAQVSTQDLLRYWSGLGFNSRALRLRDSAKIIQEDFAGKYPRDKALLMQLPGVGRYTASAILAFAYNEEVPVVDTNIRRVLIFLFDLEEDISLSDLESFAFRIIPEGRSCDWHNALMDYGALELTVRKTGIKSKSQQSRFEGSDRQVRGRIIKEIIQQKKVSLSQIQEEFPHKDVKIII